MKKYRYIHQDLICKCIFNDRSTNDDAINNESKQRGDTLPEELTMKETSASHKSQPEVSLNILSPSSDQRKVR